MKTPRFKPGDRIKYTVATTRRTEEWTGKVEEVDARDILVRWDDDGKCSHLQWRDKDITKANT